MDFETSLRYFFTVTNQGAGAAGPFTVTVTGAGSFQIPGLAAGASTTRRFRELCSADPALEQAVADSLAQIAESNETNNTRTYDENVCVT